MECLDDTRFPNSSLGFDIRDCARKILYPKGNTRLYHEGKWLNFPDSHTPLRYTECMISELFNDLGEAILSVEQLGRHLVRKDQEWIPFLRRHFFFHNNHGLIHSESLLFLFRLGSLLLESDWTLLERQTLARVNRTVLAREQRWFFSTTVDSTQLPLTLLFIFFIPGCFIPGVLSELHL